MSCEWGHDDCLFENDKCDFCVVDSMCYKQRPQKKNRGLAKHAQKADKRAGSSFEFANHKRNEKILKDAVSGMTLNSGATALAKGDEQILGCIRIMEELKTQTKIQAPGKKSFTIQKQWLDKLLREAPEENMEFWYLKFSFHEADDDVYVVVEQDVIMSMVNTMVNDRRDIIKERMRANLETRKRETAETKLIAANAEIEMLKEEIAQLKYVDKFAS